MGGQHEKVSQDDELSDEAPDSSYESEDEDDGECGEESKYARVSKIHDELLERLGRGMKVSLSEEVTPDITAKGTNDMTVLHKIVMEASHKTPFEKFRPLVEQLLGSGENRDLLSMRDYPRNQTPLYSAAASGKWEVLECLLSFEGSLEAAALRSGKDTNNCLHEVINMHMKKILKPPKVKAGSNAGEFLRRCIDRLTSGPTKRLMEDKNRWGNTPLHIAVVYRRGANLEVQKTLVSKLIKACPESMKICNAADQSPYQYRMQAIKVAEGGPDEIAFDLKDHYMHYEKREEAAKYLYGKNGEELAMELDLSEHQRTGYLFPDESRKVLSRHLKLENILRYVDFPRIVAEQARPRDQLPETKSRRHQAKPKQKELDGEGMGRKDLKAVFDWLRTCGVEKIIRVRVEDSQDPPHSDEIIETALEGFKIEVWDWIKIDLCSSTILKAAPDVSEVYLYSSGNNAVLQAWSGIDGLKKLTKLKIVNILIEQRLESVKRTKEHLKVFEDRLRRQIDGIEIRSRIKRWAGQQATVLNSPEEGSLEQTHMWVTHMNDFVNFVENLDLGGLKPRPVKVALIDDGVDGAHKILGKNIKRGISFCSRPDSHNHVYSYCVPSGCHGTQMASLIHQVCPRVELYVARIQDMEVGRNRQIDAESAVKAIDWAVNCEVDIISMSWTFQRTEDNKSILDKDLEKAIARASSKDILMFCSTGDKGRHANDDTYPACLPSVFKIGAAKASGNEAEWTESSSHFTFPGEDLRAETPTYIESKRNSPVSGSSLATALASGLAALMLYCIDITDDSLKLRENARKHTAMERAFKRMTNKNEQPRYIRAWEHLKPKFKDLPEGEGKKELKHAMEELFK